ncbi:hypothetical protein FVE85_3284 [Porphyridium purpureum]|uniref:Uncharacterized protein n=1 Tax=Porphyridium purpureum TaxID=35688 RepID=A0A5J4YWC1_PORPP|nr:hypothetical protein FVE85_3284 [Porphyridium purpureum]|eukprot:POR8686..scf227_4
MKMVAFVNNGIGIGIGARARPWRVACVAKSAPRVMLAQKKRWITMGLESHSMNLSECVVKAAEGKTLREIVNGPVHQLQGITTRADEMFATLNVKTIKDLAEWKFGKWATAIAVLQELEREGKRPAGSMMNINKAVDKEHETKSLSEIIALPPSALQGITSKADEALQAYKLDTIGKLGNWKYIKWARALVTLSECEEAF